MKICFIPVNLLNKEAPKHADTLRKKTESSKCCTRVSTTLSLEMTSSAWSVMIVSSLWSQLFQFFFLMQLLVLLPLRMLWAELCLSQIHMLKS